MIQNLIIQLFFGSLFFITNSVSIPPANLYDITNICENIGNSYTSHQFDCRLYYDCNNDKVQKILVCPYGKYHRTHNQCDLDDIPDGCETPWSKEVEIRIFYPLSKHPALPINLPVITPNTLLFNISDVCIGKEDKSVFKVNDGNCRSYRICLFGQSHISHCPIGFSFNEELMRCDTQNNRHCTETEMCPPNEMAVFEKIGSCTEYYECVNGVRGLKSCAAGLQFDRAQNRCAKSSVVSCFECPLVDDVKTPVTYPGHTLDTYRMCFKGQTLDFQCAHDLHWNQESKQCELPTS